MSAYPRRVLTGVTVSRDGVQTFVRQDSVVDIQPGSELEAAYGAQNLSAVIPTGDTSRSPEAASHLDRSWLHN